MADLERFLNKIICGDCLELLRQLPDESVDCIVTSPPYFGLRDYGEEANTVWGGSEDCAHEWGEEIKIEGRHKKGETNPGKEAWYKEKDAISPQAGKFCKKCGAWLGQLGLEPTLEMYIEHMLQITAELKRVLKKSGVFFLNWGDCYGSHSIGKGNVGGIEGEKKKRDRSYANAISGQSMNKLVSVKDKCLALQNFRTIIRMIDEQGWILRNIIIWCLAEDVKLFVKRKDKYLNIPIKKVKEGDIVFTVDKENNFRWIRIKRKFNNGRRPVLKITTKSGREIICSENHQFSVKTSYYYGKYLKLHFKKAKDLTTKDFLWVNYKLPTILPDGDGDDYQLGFVVGFFIAEGSYIKRRIGVYKDNIFSKSAQKRWGRLDEPKVVYDGIQFSCGTKDIERGYLEYLKLFDAMIKNYEGNSLSVYSRDKRLLNLIRQFVVGEHCDKKHFNQVVWNKSLQFIKGIVDGFLAGDGSYDKKNDRWRVKIKPNKQLKEDLELACRLIGYEFRYEGINNTNYGTKAMGFIIRKEMRRKTFGFLYADQIDKIEKIGEKRVYDIEVEPIYISYCGKGQTDKPSKEQKRAKWNNLYFLANGIWTHNSKPNHMPSSVKDRFANAYEPVFMLVKNKKYWFDLDAVRVPQKNFIQGKKRRKSNLIKDNTDFKEGGMAFKKGGWADYLAERGENYNPLGKNPGDVWTIPTQPFPMSHFATFPTSLITGFVQAGCPQWICKKCRQARVRITKTEYIDAGGRKQNEKTLTEEAKRGLQNPGPQGMKYDRANAQRYTIGWTDCGCNAGWRSGVVLDPFMGSGTTAEVALRMGRNFIGFEKNPEYVKMANKRIAKYRNTLFSEKPK